MPIKLVDPPKFKTKDEVPAFLLSQYEEKDGEWIAKDEGDDTTALQAALDAERTKLKATEVMLKKAAADLKKKETDTKAADSGITKEKLDEIEAAIEARLVERYTPELEEGKRAKASERSLKLDNAVKAMAGKAGFLGDKLDDYWKLHGDEFDLTDDGKPMVKANPGITVEKLIESHMAKRKEWTQGTKAAGGGAAGITTGGGANTGMSVDDQIKNPSAGLQAARAAGAKE